jgi:hypothetical protein
MQHRFRPGVSGNPKGNGLLKARTAAIYADLLAEHPGATAGARQLLACAAKQLAISQQVRSSTRATAAAIEARMLIRQAERSAKPKQKPSASIDHLLAAKREQRGVAR